jgi:mTERF domain-containing protein
MLRLRSCILTRLLSSPSSTYPIPIFPLHRLLSTAAADPSPAFAVEQYLVDTCGLTQPQAVKASAKIAHLKSPSKPDAVLAFLAGLGLSRADLAVAVAGDPKLLCADVEKTLAVSVPSLPDSATEDHKGELAGQEQERPRRNRRGPRWMTDGRWVT